MPVRRVLSLASIIVSALATAAAAKERVVIILAETYFPTVVYVETGDRLRFVNYSGKDHVVRSLDGSWSLGPLAANSEHLVNVDPSMAPVFLGTNIGLMGSVQEFRGKIVFDRSPLAN